MLYTFSYLYFFHPRFRFQMCSLLINCIYKKLQIPRKQQISTALLDIPHIWKET